MVTLISGYSARTAVREVVTRRTRKTTQPKAEVHEKVKVVEWRTEVGRRPRPSTACAKSNLAGMLRCVGVSNHDATTAVVHSRRRPRLECIKLRPVDDGNVRARGLWKEGKHIDDAGKRVLLSTSTRRQLRVG